MRRILFFLFLFTAICLRLAAQDTIVLNGQPKWKQSLDIADKSLFFEETSDKPLTFTEAKRQVFGPFKMEYRQEKFSSRPLIIQWHKFIISNISLTDTVDLRVDVGAHYFSRLYNNKQLIVVGGAFQANVPLINQFGLQIKILPHSTVTYWARNEDRKEQLMNAGIYLKTPYLSANDAAVGNYLSRYLFLLLAVLTGCLLFIGIYALYQYYLYRDTSFIYYIGYTFAALLTALFWIDIRLQLMFFPTLVRDIIFSCYLFLIPVLYTLFIGSMLKLPVHFKKTWIAVKVLLTIAILQIVIEFLQVHWGWFIFNPNYYSLVLSLLPIIIMHLILLALTALSKDPVKWFLFGGLLSLLLLWCIPITGIFGLVPSRNTELFLILVFVPGFLILGLTIEAICFSFALSYRAKLVLTEKNTLQKTYAMQLESELDKKVRELQIQNNISEAQKIKQVQTEFEQKIAETEMTALRAQMNPHFIFNCLNSIKLYTLENDSQTASEYLTIFSQLIRLVLENSQSEKVTLQKELETLRLYIELEAMRFKNKVRYEINVDPAIDQQYTDIPPLLLQPYVENAIWHGLMHKKEGGNIKIAVTQPSEHLLHIEIMDDGVGRELAAAYKSKSATRQKSFGLKMTSERINIINQLYEMKADVTITDMKDSMNNATGTKVTIQIPV
ncbi:histidine kinase [Mucilaginibacter sp.]|uniref:sensor histidine kinase n=1 Tax=Mucilaginibacter sp. TaxID=1882438 RepID=UPI0025FC47A5|nr:histidine kinase [Mucilaginibacter sp.]